MMNQKDLTSTGFTQFVLADIPLLNQKLELLISRNNAKIRETSLNGGPEDLAVNHLAISTGCLISISDSLVALNRHLIKTGPSSYEMAVFPRSTNGIIRIAIENWALYSWLQDDENTKPQTWKALAFLHENATQARKYYFALGSVENVAKIDLQLDILAKEGIALGFVSEVSDASNPQKTHLRFPSIPSMIDLCKNIDLLGDYSAHELENALSVHPGIDNGEYVYRFLSGHVHGLQWVTKFDASQEMLTKQNFVYWIPLVALGAVKNGINAISL